MATKKTYVPIFAEKEKKSAGSAAKAVSAATVGKIKAVTPTTPKPAETAKPVETVTPVFAPKVQTPKNVQMTKGRIPINDRQRYREVTREGYKQALQDSAGARFHAGVMEGLSLFSTDKATVDRYGQDTLDLLKDSKAYKGGNIAGIMGQFAIPYAGAAPKVGKLVTKIPQVAKMGKLGQGVARSVATDLIVGSPLNVNYAFNKENLTGSDAAKSIALNIGIDLVAGGLLEGLGYAIKLKSGKKIANKEQFSKLSKAEQTEALLQLAPPESEVKLLTEGINWTEGKAPIKQLPEPKMYVDPRGTADFTPFRAKGPQTENIVTSSRKQIIDGVEKTFIPESIISDAHIDKKVTFGEGDYYNLVDIMEVADRYNQDPKAIIKAAFDNSKKELDNAVDSVAKSFGKYKGKGVEFTTIRQDYGSEFNKIRNSLNEKWYSDYFKKHGKAPSVAEKERIGREMALREIETFGRTKSANELVDPELIQRHRALERLDNMAGKMDNGAKDVINNKDGTFTFVYGETKKVVKPDYSAAKGQKEMPFLATADELTFEPKRTQRKSKGVPIKKDVPKKVPFKDLGADVARPQKTADQLIKEYGKIEPGMQPRVEGRDIPKATDYGPVQKGIRTSAEAKAVNESSFKEIQKAVEDGMSTRFGVSNESVVEKASKVIADDGLDVAYGKFSAVSSSNQMPKSDDIALGYRLMQEYQSKGDYEKVAEIAVDVSEMLSETGRSLQASQIIKKLTPEGRLMSVQRVAKKLSKKYGTDIKVDKETAKKILNAKTEKDIYKVNKEAVTQMWSSIPPDLQNRLDAWRYMSMLMNPKTHVRNIVGNAIFIIPREVKNLIGSGMEKTFRVPVGQRTKAVLNPASKTDRAYLKVAHEDFKSVKEILRGNVKYDDKIKPAEARVFKTKFLEAMRKFNMEALDKEDVGFMLVGYDSSFAQYLKANKANLKNISPEMMKAAREYASNEALKATYRDANALATAVSRLKSNLVKGSAATKAGLAGKKAAGVALEGIVPFTKTPMNIIRRGVEYSPVSLFTGTADMLTAVRKGKMPAHVAIDRLAAGMSGTGIMLLGMWLGKNKIVTGGNDYSYSSKQYQYDRLVGMQEYAFNTDDGSYTLDWAAPVSMPFFVGVELSKMFGDEGQFDFAKVADALTSIDEPMFEMSMLQGINQALQTYNQDGAIGDIATNMVLSYLGQFVPTVGGQIARTTDKTRRAYVSTAESSTTRKLDKAVQKQIAKIPRASKKLEPYINLWGETETNGNVLENFLSPGFVRSKSNTKVDSELRDLIGRLDDDVAKDVMPRATAGYSVTQDKVKYQMTKSELTQFKITRGQESQKGLEKLFASSSYRRKSDEEKVKAIKKVYDDAYDKAKKELLKKKASIPIKK